MYICLVLIALFGRPTEWWIPQADPDQFLIDQTYTTAGSDTNSWW